MPKFKFNHNNINVLNLEKSFEFYQKALGLKDLKEMRRNQAVKIVVL